MDLNAEYIFYIVEYFLQVLSEEEQKAIRYAYFIINNEEEDEYKEYVKVTDRILKQYGMIQDNQSVLDYVRTGRDSFNARIANHMMEYYKDNIFFNYCPVCQKLARTPYARQCRHCGCDWHEKVIGKFKIEQILKITTREETFLLGEIVMGHINVGNYIDLQISHMPQIKVIEYARKGTGEFLALGVDITKEQKKYLEDQIKQSTVDILSD